MSVIDNYLKTLSGPERLCIAHVYVVVREVVPDATEGLSYGMPALKYKNKGLVAIMSNKTFLSLYPFGAVEKLGLDLSGFECTSGSVHFSIEKPISDDLLRNIIDARRHQIDR